MNLLEEWQLPGRRLGRRVQRYAQLDSTNSLATSLARDPNNEGLVILADAQTAGRGQHGRSWTCESGAGVLMSVLLFPPAELRRPVLLAAWAAVSVCETIRRSTGLMARIKWPNDVLIQGRKVCGILIEQARGTVVGIGLNVNQSAAALADADLPNAGSLASLVGGRLDRLQVARLLIEQLDEEYDRLCDGDVATLEACWKWHTGLLGKFVEVECHDATRRGRLLDMSWAGLELQVRGAETVFITPESVRHLSQAKDA